MTDRTQSDEREDPQDERLRRFLRDASPKPSVTHDQAVLAAAREVAGGQPSDSVTPLRPAHRRRQWAVPASLAAALLVGVFAVFISTQQSPGPDPGGVRGADPGEVSPANDALLALPPKVFEWRPRTGAHRYQVVLRDSRALVVWRSEPVEHNQAGLPVEVGSTLETGSTYMWTVEIENGSARPELGPYWFRLE